MRRTLVLVVLAALAVPAATSAAHAKAVRAAAVKQCRQQRAQMGKKVFRDLYGKKHAMKTCLAKQLAQQQQNAQNAAKQCKAARDSDAAAFADRYGKGHNAFGKCVSQTAKALAQARQEATINAAKECAAERKDNLDAFRARYGTNHNKRNAFGKCVSSKVNGK
jgi:DNA primase